MPEARETVVRELGELFAANTPIVHLVTQEEDRAVSICQTVGALVSLPVAVWSIQNGLVPVAPQAREPMALLDTLSRSTERLLVVLLDFHHCWDDFRILRRLRDLLPGFLQKGQRLAVIAPASKAPEGIAADIAVMRLPLPGRDELSVELSGLHKGALSADAQHRAVSAALGLTHGHAKRAFLRALAADAALGEKALAVILNEKRRVLARDLGLECVEAGEKIEDEVVVDPANPKPADWPKPS